MDFQTAAGITHRKPLVQMAIEDGQRVMDINVKGTLLCCRAEFDIRVNGIAPCVFWSAITEPILNEEESYKKYTSQISL